MYGILDIRSLQMLPQSQSSNPLKNIKWPLQLRLHLHFRLEAQYFSFLLKMFTGHMLSHFQKNCITMCMSTTNASPLEIGGPDELYFRPLRLCLHFRLEAQCILYFCFENTRTALACSIIAKISPYVWPLRLFVVTFLGCL